MTGGGAGSLKGGAEGNYGTTEGVVLCKTRNRLLKLAVKDRDDWRKTGRGQERQTWAEEYRILRSRSHLETAHPSFTNSSFPHAAEEAILKTSGRSRPVGVIMRKLPCF